MLGADMNVSLLPIYGINRQRQAGRLQKTAPQRAGAVRRMGGRGKAGEVADAARRAEEIPKGKFTGQTASDIQLLREPISPVGEDRL